jgi:hypothetical protein
VKLTGVVGASTSGRERREIGPAGGDLGWKMKMGCGRVLDCGEEKKRKDRVGLKGEREEGMKGGGLQTLETLNFCLKTTTHKQTKQMQRHVCIQTLSEF